MAHTVAREDVAQAHVLAKNTALLSTKPLKRDTQFSEVVQDEVPATTTTTTTTEEPWNGINEISAGPHRFYYENGNLPKFLMEVDTGKNIFD